MYLPNSISFVSSNSHSRIIIISTEVCKLVEDSVKLNLVVKITQAYMWKLQVENEHHSYHFLSTFLTLYSCYSVMKSHTELKKYIIDNSYLPANYVPSFGLILQSILTGPEDSFDY